MNSIVRFPANSTETAITNLPLTAFGDLRTAELTPQFQLSFEYTISNTEITTNTTVGSGTVTQANAMAVVGTGTTTGSTALLQSKRHAKYRSGLGGLLRYTDLFTAPISGTSQLIGLADELGSSASFKNGIMIGYDKNVNDGLVFGLYRYANDVVFPVGITDWDDPLNGKGSSTDILVPTNLNVNAIRFQFLGAGAIQILREPDEGTVLEPVHTIQYSNKNTQPSSFNPNYRAVLFVDNGATTSNMILKASSMAYFIEGKTKHSELQQPQFSSGKKQKLLVSTEVALFTIRNKTSYAGKTNFIDLLLEQITGSIEANNANNLGELRIVRNATLGGTPVYADINTTDSIVEIDVAGTTVAGGKEITFIPLAGKNAAALLDLTDLEIILAPGETITVSGESVNDATINGGGLWKELF